MTGGVHRLSHRSDIARHAGRGLVLDGQNGLDLVALIGAQNGFDLVRLDAGAPFLLQNLDVEA